MDWPGTEAAGRSWETRQPKESSIYCSSPICERPHILQWKHNSVGPNIQFFEGDSKQEQIIFSRRNKSFLLHSCSFCDAKLGRTSGWEIGKTIGDVLRWWDRFFSCHPQYICFFLRCQMGTMITVFQSGKKNLGVNADALLGYVCLWPVWSLTHSVSLSPLEGNFNKRKKGKEKGK